MRFRKATAEDIPEIVKMLANDALGSIREDFNKSIPKSYFQAFQNIENDVNQELIVLEDSDNIIVGTLQLSFIKYLS